MDEPAECLSVPDATQDFDSSGHTGRTLPGVLVDPPSNLRGRSKGCDESGLGRCELPNERNAFAYLNQHIFPSLKALSLTSDELAFVATPVLVIHGRKDRSAPYGGGRDWASHLPNARLLTVDNAGHMPWIEAPDQVFHAIETFLSGTWPEAAVRL